MPKNPSLVIEDDTVETTGGTPWADKGQDVNDEFHVPEPDQNMNGRAKVDLSTVGFDDARDEVERKKLLNPAGDWLKSEPWDFDPDKNVSVFDTDRAEGDINPSGRTIYTLWGYPDTRKDKEGNEFTPFLRLRMSPDKRMHREKEGQVDFSYKLFLSAKDMFITLYDRRPRNQLELLQCLADDVYVINTMNGDDGPFILRVKAPRKKG